MLHVKNTVIPILNSFTTFFNGLMDIKEEKSIPKEQWKPGIPRSVYENRRKEISDSSEPIEGVFYIINGQVVADHYSECLFSEVDAIDFSVKNLLNPRKREMYCHNFYKNYIRRVYGDIASSPCDHSLPRGRVDRSILEPNTTSIYIDKCYLHNQTIIQYLIEHYRLSGKIDVISHSMYRCPACSGQMIWEPELYALYHPS